MEYDFELVHITGTRNGWADALSRRPDYDKGDEDNKKLVMLPERFFTLTVQARLAGTEWADPHNTEEWQRFAKNEDNIANYQSVHDSNGRPGQQSTTIDQVMGKYPPTHTRIWTLVEGDLAHHCQ